MVENEERRENTRVEVRWPITLLSDRGRISGETRNISLTGIFMRSEKPLKENEFLRLALEPPKENSIWVSGKVVWSDTRGEDGVLWDHSMGFCFVEISEADRTLLEDLLTVSKNIIH
jgi:hypothetical protein